MFEPMASIEQQPSAEQLKATYLRKTASSKSKQNVLLNKGRQDPFSQMNQMNNAQYAKNMGPSSND